MSRKLTPEEVMELFGRPAEQVAAELDSFSKAAQSLEEQRPQLTSEHAQQWVGLYDGKVEVFGSSVAAVMEQIGEKGYPEAEVVVKYITREPQPLIV